ncbi:MAG: hypothetical protein JXB60_07980 [Candidatus Cloacimonetes bacterium]|nr:hypothetical protein [Candidatus Cloacimonadota bacterium]
MKRIYVIPVVLLALFLIDFNMLSAQGEIPPDQGSLHINLDDVMYTLDLYFPNMKVNFAADNEYDSHTEYTVNYRASMHLEGTRQDICKIVYEYQELPYKYYEFLAEASPETYEMNRQLNGVHAALLFQVLSNVLPEWQERFEWVEQNFSRFTYDFEDEINETVKQQGKIVQMSIVIDVDVFDEYEEINYFKLMISDDPDM